MLDVARVRAHDFVIDLGSGDGRSVITAAARGQNGSVDWTATALERR
jgi:methylase of polypeptide subunit release factors